MISVQEIITGIEIGLIYGIVAAGIFLSFRVINFTDMTCDGSFILGAAVSSRMIHEGFDPILAMALAMVAGGLGGLFTGFLNIYLGIKDLLAGIVVAFILYSVNLRIMGSIPNITFENDCTIFCNGDPLIKIFLIVSSLVLLFYFLFKTDFGLGMRSVGQNRTFSSSVGINTDFIVMIGVILSNMLVGVSGAIFTQYSGFCDISQGTGTLVIGLASVMLGEKIFQSSNAGISIISCIFGSIIYRIFIALAVRADIMGLTTQDLNILMGLMMIAVAISGEKKCCS